MTFGHGGKLLGSSPEGIVSITATSGKSKWISTMPGNVDAALPEAGAAVVARNNWAVVRYENGQLSAIAGAFPLAGSKLLAHPDGHICVLASGGGRCTLTVLDDAVGSERQLDIAFSPAVLGGAVLPGNRLYLAGMLRCGVLDIGENMVLNEDNWFNGPPVEANAVAVFSENIVLTAGRSKDNGINTMLYATDLVTHDHTKLLELESCRVTSLFKGKTGFYLLVDVFTASGQERAILMEAKVPTSALR